MSAHFLVSSIFRAHHHNISETNLKGEARALDVMSESSLSEYADQELCNGT